MANYVGTDTDGTKWVTVRFTTEVQVMADEADDYAVHLAELALPDANWEHEFVEVS